MQAPTQHIDTNVLNPDRLILQVSPLKRPGPSKTENLAKLKPHSLSHFNNLISRFKINTATITM